MISQHLRRSHRFKLGCKRKGRSKWLALYDVHDHSIKPWGPILCLGCRKSLDDRRSWYDHDERWCVRSQTSLQLVWNAVYIAFNDILAERHAHTQRHDPHINQDALGILSKMHLLLYPTQIRFPCNRCIQQNIRCGWASSCVSSCIRCAEHNLPCEPRTQQESRKSPVNDEPKRRPSIIDYNSHIAEIATKNLIDYASDISLGHHGNTSSLRLYGDNSPQEEILSEYKSPRGPLSYDLLCPSSPSPLSTQELSVQVDRQYMFLDGTSSNTFRRVDLSPPPESSPRAAEENGAESCPTKNDKGHLL